MHSRHLAEAALDVFPLGPSTNVPSEKAWLSGWLKLETSPILFLYLILVGRHKMYHEKIHNQEISLTSIPLRAYTLTQL